MVDVKNNNNNKK